MIESGAYFVDNWAGATEAFCRDSATPLNHGGAVIKLPAYEDTKVGVPTSVYKYYDRANILIYVGITNGGILRNRQHNDSNEWWKFVAKQEVEHFKSRGLAHEREVVLIEQFRPPFNKQHNKDHEAVRRYYLDMVEGHLPAPRSFNNAFKQQQTLDLRVLAVDHRTREVEFVAPYEGVCATLSLVADPQVSPAQDQNSDHLGHVTRIVNAGLFVSVFVKLQRPAFLNHRIESAVGYLKNVEIKKQKVWVFKRISALVSPPLRKRVA